MDGEPVPVRLAADCHGGRRAQNGAEHGYQVGCHHRGHRGRRPIGSRQEDRYALRYLNDTAVFPWGPGRHRGRDEGPK